MSNLIERYVYDVTRRLPEKDREEVRRELTSNIYDMLTDDADEGEIKKVLYDLGEPSVLAEKYRQNPRYLISPVVYDDYVRILKWLLPLAGMVVFAIGVILGAFDSIKDGMVNVASFISTGLTKGVSLGCSAVFQVLIWTTIGFVVAERTGAFSDKNKDEAWKLEDLPELLPDDKNKIPLADSIVELVLMTVFSVAALLACKGLLPIIFRIEYDGGSVSTLFSQSFLSLCVPFIIVMMLFSIAECAVKIKARRWTSSVFITVVICDLVRLGMMLFLLYQPNMLSTEFTKFVQTTELGKLDILRIAGNGGLNVLFAFVAFIMVVCTLIGCATAAFKTFGNKNRNVDQY